MPITVSNPIREAIREEAASMKLRLKNNQATALPVFLDTQRFDLQLAELQYHVGNLQGKRLLEIGSGYGILLAYARLQRNLDFYGLEPASQEGGRYSTAIQILRENHLDERYLSEGKAERMPFPDQHFDVVFSFQVLEHVQDPVTMLSESWRVLKPGGFLYINAPNYRSFYEGHYEIPWFPGLSKKWAKWYVRLWGRDPRYLESLNFITEAWLKKNLEQICGFKISSDFGMANWLERMQNPVFSPYTSPHLIRLVKGAQKTGLLRILSSIGQKNRSQDTLRVAVRKPSINRQNAFKVGD